MTINFDINSFVAGLVLALGPVLGYLNYRIKKMKIQLEKVESSNTLRDQLFEKMSLLKDKRELYADIRDNKIDIEGIRPNILIQLQTEIDLIYDDIIAKEQQLAKIENRKPRKISKSHGVRPAPPGDAIIE